MRGEIDSEDYCLASLINKKAPKGAFYSKRAVNLNQQRIHPSYIRRRVARHAAFSQQRLVKQDMRQVVEVD